MRSSTFKISKHCKFGPKVFRERLKAELSNRIDRFFDEAENTGRTREEWMKEFFFWSRNHTWNKEQETLYPK